MILLSSIIGNDGQYRLTLRRGTEGYSVTPEARDGLDNYSEMVTDITLHRDLGGAMIRFHNVIDNLAYLASIDTY